MLSLCVGIRDSQPCFLDAYEAALLREHAVAFHSFTTPYSRISYYTSARTVFYDGGTVNFIGRSDTFILRRCGTYILLRVSHCTRYGRRGGGEEEEEEEA